MMFCNPAFILFAVFKHREISYPAEAEFIFINEIHTACHFEAEFAKRLGDTVAVMDDGRVVHAGTMAELAADEGLQQRLLGLSL